MTLFEDYFPFEHIFMLLMLLLKKSGSTVSEGFYLTYKLTDITEAIREDQLGLLV